jgi:transcriptional regulator of NAD metabolism
MMSRAEVVEMVKRFEVDGMSLYPEEIDGVVDEVMENYDSEVWETIEDCIETYATLVIYPDC